MSALRTAACSCAIGVVLLSPVTPLGAQGGSGYAVGGSSAMTVQQSALRRVTLELRDVTLREALKAVEAESGVSLVYASSTVPLDRRVSLRMRNGSVEAALRDLLRGTDVEVRAVAAGRIMLVRREGGLGGGAGEGVQVPLGAVVSGRVTDSVTGVAVSRAVVTVDAGARRATTGDDGVYRLTDVPAGTRVVRVRRIGFAPTERSVDVPESGTTTADFVLAPVASRLDEVVTTVTGEQRRLEVGNAIGMIDADSVVREAPVMSFADLINARVSGTQVLLNNGLTGTSPRIRIRGLNSLTVSNDPLLVVDGVRISNTGSSVGSGFGHSPGRFNDLNPNEIASVEIVKGPSAATLYGTDAANGVIVVKTKRGRTGRAVWDAYAEAGRVDQGARFPDNYYAWGRNTTTDAVQQCFLALSAANTCQIDSVTTFNPLMNRETTPIGTGSRQQYGLQVSGGTSGFTYFMAGEYESETGFLRMPGIDRVRISEERGGTPIPAEQLRPNALRRVSFRANGGAAVGATADIYLGIGIVSSGTRITGDGVIGSGVFGPGYRTARDGWVSLLSRPGEAFAVRNVEDAMHYITSINANWRPSAWSTVRATTGVDFSTALHDGLQRRGEGPLGAGRNGRRISSRSNTVQYTGDLGASTMFTPWAHTTSRTSVGIQYNRQILDVTTASGTNLSPGAETITGAAVVTGSERTVESIVAGTYAEQTLGLADRLFLTAAIRADGGSAFGRDFRAALYPKASVSWVAIGKRDGTLNSARVRAAYGASGVQPASTASLALIALSPVLVDGSTATGARLGALGNPNLKPERQSEFEAGVDAELLTGRVRLEATYYDRLSRDALIDRPLSSEVGLASRQENIGSVRNRGLEALGSLTLIESHSVTWIIGANGSINRNRLEKIGAGIPFIGPNPAVRSMEGYPLLSKFARPILGFSDADGDGIITESEVRVGDTLVYVGHSLPPRQLTTSSSLTVFGGRVRIATHFDYRGGHRVVNYSEVNRCSTFLGSCRAANDRAAPLEDQARAIAASSALHGRTLYGYIEDASFVRWRELGVTYTVPEAIARRLNSQRATITVTGRNLHLFTSYSGGDPEVNDAPGITEGYGGSPTAPPARYLLLRVNLGF